jgi:hypothetical protein
VGVCEEITKPLANLDQDLALSVGQWHRPLQQLTQDEENALIGMNFLHLHSIPGLGTPVVSIRDTETFDGVFLRGIIAVLLIWACSVSSEEVLLWIPSPQHSRSL